MSRCFIPIFWIQLNDSRGSRLRKWTVFNAARLRILFADSSRKYTHRLTVWFIRACVEYRMWGAGPRWGVQQNWRLLSKADLGSGRNYPRGLAGWCSKRIRVPLYRGKTGVSQPRSRVRSNVTRRVEPEGSDAKFSRRSSILSFEDNYLSPFHMF
jgi:hypothetical protein